MIADKEYWGVTGITEIPNEPGRFWVPSSRPGEPPYVVDLSEHQGNGECSCPGFHGHKVKAIRAGAPLFTQATTCRHLRDVRTYFCIRVLNAFAEKIKAQERDTDPFANAIHPHYG